MAKNQVSRSQGFLKMRCWQKTANRAGGFNFLDKTGNPADEAAVW